MGLYVLRRLGFLVVLIIGVSLMVFIISHMVPSDPVVVNLSKRNLNNPKMVAAFKEKWGLDKPLHIQYLIYLKKLCQLDMGVSIKTKRPVIEDLKRYLPATAEMASLGLMFAVFFGMIFGVISAVRRNSITDQVVRALSVSGIAIPNFWISLVVLYIFYYKLGWAPGPGRLSPIMDPPATVTGLYTVDALLQGDWEIFWNALHHLILPSLVLGLFTMGLITRTTRSSLLETLSQDYIRTARAKGLTEQMIVVKHALGNALIPVITVIGLGFSNLLGGTVLVETIFGWPGIGMYAYKSATSLDFPAIIGVALFLAVNFVVINLIIDLLYGVIDPRVRHS